MQDLNQKMMFVIADDIALKSAFKTLVIRGALGPAAWTGGSVLWIFDRFSDFHCVTSSAVFMRHLRPHISLCCRSLSL
jgi:hypothetical protein